MTDSRSLKLYEYEVLFWSWQKGGPGDASLRRRMMHRLEELAEELWGE